MRPVKSTARFQRFTWAVLAATLAVILWGAYVRASGSGAGCGSHWPTCNGQIIPRDPGMKTVIEFTHRATSGIAFLMVLAQLIWALRLYPRGHAVRRAAAGGFALMVTEALVGGGLVIFEMVAGNKSVARAFWMAAHLMNTFALLAALGLTVWRARGGERRAGPPVVLGPGLRGGVSVALAVLLVTAASGAIVALGDTLFPARSLGEGLAQDFADDAHLFVRLRIVHPVLAVLAGSYLLVLTAMIAGRDPEGPLRPAALRTGVLVALQLGVGFLNLGLLAPTALQIVHLLLADLLWLALVVLAAEVRVRARAPVHARAPQTAPQEPLLETR
jgi:heme A synthase